MKYNSNIRQRLINKNKKFKIKSSKNNLFKYILAFLFIITAIFLGTIVALVLKINSILPSIDDLEAYKPSQTSFIYDAKKNIIARLHDEENRIVIPLEQIPQYVKNAVISIEDARFYEHKGVDLIGLLRAVKNNLLKQKIKEGGSSITQQLAKNLFLTPERTLTRKIAEALISIKIEQKYSKDKILELYLNQVYWGHNAYGIEAASQLYFGKSTSNLTLAEGAMLAGLLTGPEIYSPYKNFDLAKKRQKLVLENMVKYGYISQEDSDKAFKSNITLKGLGVNYRFPYFTTYVLSILREDFTDEQIRQGGLRVYTTVIPEYQEFAENLIKRRIKALSRNNVHQGALVCLEPKTGYIRAMVGGVDFKTSQFNRAVQAQRQPGSSFKPFIYLTAFASGYSPNSIEVDEKISYNLGYKTWTPKNYDGSYRGPMTLQYALEHSVNTIAVKLLDKLGTDKVIETAKTLGINSPLGNNLSLALGSYEVNLLEIVNAYATIAAGGIKAEPICITRIEDSDGNLIKEYKPQSQYVYDKRAISTLIKVMKGVILRGTGTAANIGRPCAGKTGTTDDHYDAWFIGFIPQLVTGVWVGNDLPSRMWGGTGGGFCAPIWAEFMRYAVQNIPVKDFEDAQGSLPVLTPTKSVEPDKPIEPNKTTIVTPTPSIRVIKTEEPFILEEIKTSPSIAPTKITPVASKAPDEIDNILEELKNQNEN